MAKLQPVALVFAGPVSRGTLSQLPGLRERLRWIKSSSVATATRAVRGLRAGVAVRDYADLSAAAVVLISVPEQNVQTWADALANCGLSWHKKIAVLYDSTLASDALKPLHAAGAAVATLNYHARPEQFVCEGDAVALRALRDLAANKPLIPLTSKERYFRAVRRTRDEFIPMFASCIEDFRAAGMQKAAAEKAAAAGLQESVRSYLRAGHRVLNPPSRGD